MSTERAMSRRGVLRAAAGAAGAAGTAGTAAGKEDGGGGTKRPDFGGWLEGIDGGYRDGRGMSDVTVQVGAQGNGGAFAFKPAGLWVDPGTTVKWKWTGEGGGHNVHAVEGASFQSEIHSTSGVHFEHTFEEGGIVNYQCDPHAALGMKGAVAVGSDVPTITVGGGGGGGPSIPDSAKTIGVATFVAMASTLGLAFALLKYGGGGEPRAPE